MTFLSRNGARWLFAGGALAISLAAAIGWDGARVSVASTAGPDSPAPPPAASAPGESAPQTLEKNGVRVEFSAGRPGAKDGPALMDGDHAEVRFRITDPTSGLPLRGLNPAAWMDLGTPLSGSRGEEDPCKEKVALYLKGIVGIRPMVDLNSYHLLVLNQDPTLSVIDPIVSVTGKTSLYAMVVLKSAGADWTKSRDEKRLFVSMPKAGQVAVVDTETFRVSANLEAGTSPTRVVLQPDGRYLWVGNDGADAEKSGVTVIDADTLGAVATVPTGRGHHELAFSSDGKHAFVSNRDEGTVSVVEMATLKKVKDVATGPVPISLAFSSLSQVLYVADGKEGVILALHPETFEVVARIAAKPGLGPLRFSPDGRWGFVVNPVEHAVHLIDAAENRLVHTLPAGGQPFQVSFTRAFAYFRLLDSERVGMVNLSTLGTENSPVVQGFSAGAAAPQLAGTLSLADSISPASTEAAVFVVSPAENTTYFYMEGMNAPMGSFGNYGHHARAVNVVDRSLRETEPGVYTSRLKLPLAGRYDVAFLLDSPSVLHCFSMEVRENPTIQRERLAVEVEYLDFPQRPAPGEVALRVRLKDPATHQPLTGLRDVRVLSYASPGQHRSEVLAQELEKGVYEARLTLVASGAYFLYLAVPSRGVNAGDLPFRTLKVDGATRKPERVQPPEVSTSEE